MRNPWGLIGSSGGAIFWQKWSIFVRIKKSEIGFRTLLSYFGSSFSCTSRVRAFHRYESLITLSAMYPPLYATKSNQYQLASTRKWQILPDFAAGQNFPAAKCPARRGGHLSLSRDKWWNSFGLRLFLSRNEILYESVTSSRRRQQHSIMDLQRQQPLRASILAAAQIVVSIIVAAAATNPNPLRQYVPQLPEHRNDPRIARRIVYRHLRGPDRQFHDLFRMSKQVFMALRD